MSSKKILIAPLDWGLGHASRCIPIIRKLIDKNVEVHIGGSGKSGQFLQYEFPDLSYHEIPGYEVTYSTRLPMAITMLRQAPSILKAIQLERKWLEENMELQKWNAVISDHRYGLHHPNTYSVFMAHQLFISSGNNDMIEPVLWKVNKSYITQFDHCWIPDLKGEVNLSGKLSHKQDVPFNHSFIGLLSRFQPNSKIEKKYRTAFILSGLEPLRTELEHILIDQVSRMKEGKLILVRGTKNHLKTDPPETLDVVDLANSDQMESIIYSSEMIVSRAGYSSIMDYFTTGSKALLIPTPGQTEQEYLARYHLESGNFYSVMQSELDLERDLKLAATYQPAGYHDEYLLDAAMDELLSKI